MPDDNPIDVTSALADIAHNYTKRKFVFRLTTQSGLEMLLQVMKPFNAAAVAMVICMQAEGQTSLMNWVKSVQRCNEEGFAVKVGVVCALVGVAGYVNV